jgi:hypothetical protein
MIFYDFGSDGKLTEIEYHVSAESLVLVIGAQIPQ